MFCLRFLSALAFCLAALPSCAATFNVNSTADVVDATPGNGVCETAAGNGVCTLRAAVQEAGALPGANTIVIPAGTYSLSATPACSYKLAGNQSLTESMSALCILGTVTISGAGSNATIIDAGGAGGVSCCGSYPSARGMVISASSIASISGVTIQNGVSSGGYTVFGGGAINNQGKLILSNSVLTANKGIPGGGGIWNNGTLAVDSTAFTANLSGGYGGAGLYNDGGATATITNSTFSYGNSSSNAAGIVNAGTLTVSACTISNNTAAGNGGGVFNAGSLTLTNVTISGNTAQNAAGIQNDAGTATANNVTIAFNHAMSNMGGVGGTITIRNTLIGANIADGSNGWTDCGPGSAVISQGHNLISNINGCPLSGATATDIHGKDPGLATLASNGGATQTHALLSTSPAVDAGDPSTPGSGSTACASTDQRGIFRPQNGKCDIGAFERSAALSITGILPSHAGNSGIFEAILSGNGITVGATAKLRRTGQPDILGNSGTVQDGNSAMASSFDLTGKTTGAWDVVITNPDNTTVTLPGGFTVDVAGSPQVWTEVAGPVLVRPGTTARYTIVYGNRGNVDAVGVPLTLSVPTQIGLSILFPVTTPPAQSGQVALDWSRAPLYVLPGPQNGVVNVPFFLPVIPPGFSGALRLTLAVPATLGEGDSISFSALAGDPIFNPGLDTNFLNALVAGAQTYALANLGVTIPASKIPSLNQYDINQLQNAVANGRAALNSSIGGLPQVYSFAQMSIDRAEFGAANATNQSAPVPDTRSSKQAGQGGSGSNSCSGQVLQEGSSCGDKPQPIPDPNDKDKKPFTPADCRAIGGHHVSSDGGTCVPDDKKCPAIQNPVLGSDPSCVRIPIKSSVDPNAKWGPLGPGTQLFRSSGAAFNYNVQFENLATASLPAQQVVVTDQLDTATLDLSTFGFGPITFGAYTLTPSPGLKQFSSALDLRPALNLIVKVDAALNQSTGLVTWRFTSLDVATEQVTTDPSAGFLPPDATPPQGEAQLLYSISPKAALASGATICNQAIVVFDTNAPINTQNWCNTLDSTKPVSHVQALPATAATTTFTVQWTGSDSGSGVQDYTIYVSDNGGPYGAWLSNTTATQANYMGVKGHTYGFYSIARDLVGNTENPKTVADATTSVPLPMLSLSRTLLNFGVGGSLATGPQIVTLTFPNGALSWTAASNQTNITVSPMSGTGNATLQISAAAGVSGIVTVTAPGASNSPQQIQVNVAAVTPGNPFGSFDTPLDKTSGVAGAIPVTGWALDSVEITKVDIWREPVVNEPSGGLVYIGDAVFVSDARTDVAILYPNAPFNYRAGWGYLILTNFLPNSSGTGALGNGTYKLHAIAHNKAGAMLDLGTRTITVNNAQASKPFGTIDTPTQGGTISGNQFVNFGWALTQNPNCIPNDGSTLTVYIDGQPLPGHPVYNNKRNDIATLFPGLCNSNGAIGYYIIDTTQLTNAVHTIFWIAFDDHNRGEGLGSRYFIVFNTGTPAASVEDAIAPVEGVKLRRGYDPKSRAETLNPDASGVITIAVEELERIELHLGAKSGYLRVNGARAPLPIGSSLKAGTFYWHLGPGFNSSYQLVFECPDGTEIPVTVRVRPKVYASQ